MAPLVLGPAEALAQLGIQYIGDLTLEGRKGLEATRNPEIGGLRSFGIPFAISFVQLRSIELDEVIPRLGSVGSGEHPREKNPFRSSSSVRSEGNRGNIIGEWSPSF